MTSAEIIAAFGGVRRVSVVTGASRTAVGHWRHNGIPGRHWPSLVAEAQRLKIDGVTLDVLAWRPATGKAAAPVAKQKRRRVLTARAAHGAA